MNRRQKGGFGLGIIIGLLVGLGLALAVALYVTKVPVPFVDKVPQRTPEQEAAEAERNKRWDPNAPLAGKRSPLPPADTAPAPTPPEPGAAPLPPPPEPPPRSTATAPAVPPAPPTSAETTPRTRPGAPATTPPTAKSARDPAAILSGESATPPAVTAPSTSTARSTRGDADAFTYFVQVGAYARVEDAEQQRARLAMLGYTARVTEREQSGRTVYRVRLGPYERKEEAEMAQDRLRGSTIESALVRVER
jgi:cell division protein FtsN